MTLEQFLALTAEQIKNMTVEEIDAALQAVKAILETNPDTDARTLASINTQMDAIEGARTAATASIEHRNLLNRIAAGTVGGEVRTFHADGTATSMSVGAGTSPPDENEDPYAKAEYRRAFFKTLVNRNLTTVEQRAFVHTTGMDAAPLPTQTLNEIWSLVEQEHAIMDDIRIMRTGTAIEVTVHKSIDEGNAKKVNEATANVDEKNTFVKVTLVGKDFSKHVDISYAMAKMSIDAMEDYLITEIADQLGNALADDVIATIITGIDANNKITSATTTGFAYKDITKAFGLLKRAKQKVVYVNNSTLYNQLANIVDDTGRPIFQPSMQEDIAGVLLGAKIKIEESVSDNVLLAGAPTKVTYNMVQDIIIETDRDIKKHVITHAGYARGEGALLDNKAFVQLTLKTV